MPQKNFPLKIFGYRAIYEKVPLFTDFFVRTPKKKYLACVPTILIPPTFPIASLNGYTPNFSGGPKSWPGVTGLASSSPAPSKVSLSEKLSMILGLFRCFFLDRTSFPSQTVHFVLYHVLHILKAIVPADNLSYQERSFEHPTRCQIFANTVGRIYVNSILQCVTCYIYVRYVLCVICVYICVYKI